MNRQRIIIGLMGALALLAVAVFSRTLGYGFVEFDDDIYVTGNPSIRLGLSLEGWRWAWTTMYAAFWHPVTWLSLLADYQFHGLDGRYYHCTNVLLHALNGVLLFGLLNRMTDSVWRSAWVAAVFAVHPLHVESVAWVAERKDVLSTCLGLGAMLAYVRLAQGGSRRWLGLSLLLYVLSLAAKPMLVTLPLLLVLLDFWPLKRRIGIRGQVMEKALYLVPAILFSVVAVVAQQRSGALPVEPGPLWFRLVTAVLAAGWYLLKMAVPSGLAPFYPWQAGWPLWSVALSALALAGGTWLAVRLRTCRPWLLAGWLWFGMTLLPVSGVIRVGSHAWADRYTYLPMVGIALMLAWEAGERVRARPAWRRPAAWAAVAILLALAAGAWRQTGYWADTERLFRRTLAVTGPNPMIESNLSAVLVKRGKLDDAFAHASRAVALNPANASAHNNLGVVLAETGRLEEAAAHYARAAELRPDYAEARANLGGVLLRLNRPAEAVPFLENAAARNPADDKVLSNMGSALFLLGRTDEAGTWYEKARAANPASATAAFNLGAVREKQGRYREAAAWFEKAAALKPGDLDAVRRMGDARKAAETAESRGGG
jgi:tetratricopeptide (TPR) repeat protein